MESIPPILLKKLWNMARILLFARRKGMGKTRPALDLHILVERGKLARKALSQLFLHHHSPPSTPSSSSSSTAVLDYPARAVAAAESAEEYEFSCSSTPVWHPRIPFRRPRFSKDRRCPPPPRPESPARGGSPTAARKLRITDSPFPMLSGGDEDSGRVDRAAEEFILGFYQKLRLEEEMAGDESPEC